MKEEAKFKTTVDLDSQRIHMEFQDLAGKYHRWLYETHEKELRKALIELGWTPPNPNKNKGLTRS